MSQSLQDYLSKKKPSPTETLALLGKPDFSETIRVNQQTIYTYKLGSSGPSSSFDAFTPRVLIILFGPRGEFQGAKKRGS